MWFKVFLFLLLATPSFAGLPPTRILDEGTDKGVAFKFDCVGAGIVCSQSGVTGTLTVGTGSGGDSISIDGVAVTDPNFNSTGDVDFVDTANVITGTVVSVRPAAENSIEALLDLQDLQGAVTDGQVPNTITIDLATTATTANAGDSATAFFASGTLEETLLPDSATVTGWVLGTSSATQITSPTVIVDLLDASGAVDMDYGSADVTDHTFIADGTTDADFVVPLTSIGAGEIVTDSLTTTQLAATLTFADGDLLDFGTNISSATEGILIPAHATTCASATAEGQICWEEDANLLWVGDAAASKLASPKYLIGADDGASRTDTFWIEPFGRGGTTETNQDKYISPEDCTASAMYAEVQIAPGAGNSWTVCANVNGTVLAEPCCTISGTGVNCSELVSTGAIVGGQTLNWEFLESGTATGTATANIVMICTP